MPYTPDPSQGSALNKECVALLKEIERVTKEQDAIWAEVGDVVTDEDDVGLQVELISDTKYHQLYSAKEKAAKLATSIAESAKIAKQSSRRVKEIDKLKARVNSTLDLATGVSKQGSSLEGITTALSKCDYEAAAEIISEYYIIEDQLKDIAALEEQDSDEELATQEVIDKTDSEDDDVVGVRKPGTRATAQLLHAKRDEVRDAVRKEFNESAAAQDRDGVVRFSKLYKKVGLTQEGVEQYSRWLQQGCGAQLTLHVESTLDTIAKGSKTATHLTLVSEVLDHIVSTIEAEDAHITEFFGESGVAVMVNALHEECTKHSVSVLNSFLTNRNLTLTGSRSPTPQSTPTHQGQGLGNDTDTKKMDQTLEEISHLSYFCFLYFDFLKKKRGVTGEPALTDKLHELLGCYIPLQREYLAAAFGKALDVLLTSSRSADSGNTPGNTSKGSATSQSPTRFSDPKAWKNLMDVTVQGTNFLGLNQEEEHCDGEAATTFVDDIFFILRTTVERVVRTRSGPIIGSVLNIITDLIRDNLLIVLKEKLTLKRENQIAPKNLYWMNACLTCKEYCAKLNDFFMALCPKDFAAEGEAAMEQYKASGQDLLTAGSLFDELLLSVIGKTKTLITKQMYEKGLKSFDELSYVLGEEKLIHYEICDAWVRAAIQQWEEMLRPYTDILNIENMNVLIAEIVGWTVKQMEVILMKKSYDVCGGLQLDRDIRAVKQYFSGKTEKPIREKFTRLSHIAALLIVDRLAEVEDLWTGGAYSSGALMWRLNPDEAKKVLLLRKDLPAHQIRALNLMKGGH